MLLDMIHDNHAEPAFKTRYRDAALLREYGYEGVVIPDALTVVPMAQRGPAAVSQLRLGDIEAGIDRRVRDALAAGLKVFFYGDAFLLPRDLVDGSPAEYLCNDHSGRVCAGKPAVYRALGAMVGELFERWPAAVGLVMRTAEVYPQSTPHMVGNALLDSACPFCRSIGPVARQRRFIDEMYAVVAGQLGRMYVHRAWQRPLVGAPTMHDDQAIYRMVTVGMPTDEKLRFSFKFTRGDFLPGQPWNPVIAADDRPKWIEFQCEREFEGKGAFPNFQPALWTALKDLPRELVGCVWGWSRGGGWGGPYVQREEWIDANVFGLSELYKNPRADVQAIALKWAAKAFGIDPTSKAAGRIVEVLMLSEPAIAKLVFTRALADRTGGAQPHQPWLRDDLIDVDAVWEIAGRAVAQNVGADVCAEKLQGVANVERMRELFESIADELPSKTQARDLSNTLIYYNSFAGTVGHMFCGFIKFLQWQRGGRGNAGLADEAADQLDRAQAHWQHHTQRHAMLPGAPSVFNETSFWERTNACLEELQGNL
jgi:hypothetical protein